MDPQDNPTNEPVVDEAIVEPVVDEPANDEVPADVLRANLTKANQEAAKYRTRLREVEAALAARKTDEDVESLLNGLTTTHATEARNLLVENVALKHNLPADLAARLVGSTREELEADALALAKFAPPVESDEVPPGDLNGGLNPGNESDDDGLTPRERVRKIKGYR